MIISKFINNIFINFIQFNYKIVQFENVTKSTYVPPVYLINFFPYLSQVSTSNLTETQNMAVRVKPTLVSLLILLTHSIASSSTSRPTNPTSTPTPTPTPWPEQFHSIIFMITNETQLQKVDLWYDWPNGRNFNIIQNQLGKLLYDLEWTNGTSFYYTLDSNQECRVMLFPVGILTPDWLHDASYVGQKSIDGFLCNVWEKVEFITYYEDVVSKRPVSWTFYTGMCVVCLLNNLVISNF